MPAGVEKLEGRWIWRTPYGVNGNIDFDQTTIHAEHFDGLRRTRTSNQTVMSVPRDQEKPVNPDESETD